MFDQPRTETFGGQTYTTWHGSPFDRGSADSYYHRDPVPHWYPKVQAMIHVWKPVT